MSNALNMLITQYPSGLIKVICSKITKEAVVGEGDNVKEALGDLLLKKGSVHYKGILFVSDDIFEDTIRRCRELKYVSRGELK